MQNFIARELKLVNLFEFYGTTFNVVDVSSGLFYFAYIAACVMTSGAQPLYYEIACENLFPVSEAVISGFLAFLLNVGSSLFLLVTLIPGIGKRKPFVIMSRH